MKDLTYLTCGFNQLTLSPHFLKNHNERGIWFSLYCKAYVCRIENVRTKEILSSTFLYPFLGLHHHLLRSF